MTFQVVRAHPGEISPVLAKLYQASEQDLAGTLSQLTAAWLVQDVDGEIAGAIGLRPSPAHGAEVMGGTFPGVGQEEATLALLKAAQTSQPHLYAYAELGLLPRAALEAAGLRHVGAYTRMTGPLPTQWPDVPEGLSLVPLSEARSWQDRLTAQRLYSDRIGHSHVPDEAVQPDFLGSDDTLGRLAYDTSGNPAGLCRAWLEGDKLALGTPSVRPDLRGTGLRQALFLAVCQAAQASGVTHVEVDAWGDTETERADDAGLGLTVEVETPILMV